MVSFVLFISAILLQSSLYSTLLLGERVSRFLLGLGSSRVIFLSLRSTTLLHFSLSYYSRDLVCWKKKTGQDSNRGPPGCRESTLLIRPQGHPFIFSICILVSLCWTPFSFFYFSIMNVFILYSILLEQFDSVLLNQGCVDQLVSLLLGFQTHSDQTYFSVSEIHARPDFRHLLW